MSMSGKQFSRGAYQKPHNVNYDKKFVVKIQAMVNDSSPIWVYDESRTCDFHIHHGQPGFSEVLAEARKERAWEGRKTYMKASFDRGGTCTIYPGKAGTKSHYTW